MQLKDCGNQGAENTTNMMREHQISLEELGVVLMVRNLQLVRIKVSRALLTYLNTQDRIKELPPLQVGNETCPEINQGGGKTQEGFGE